VRVEAELPEGKSLVVHGRRFALKTPATRSQSRKAGREIREFFFKPYGFLMDAFVKEKGLRCQGAIYAESTVLRSQTV
jgi:hypothetical protein